jgi:hypothetical protein
MSAGKTRFRAIKLDELKKILPDEALNGNNNHNHDQSKKKTKERAGPAGPRKGSSHESSN